MDNNNIYVIYGDDPPKAMVLQVLNEVKPERGMDKDTAIGIKPNLVVAKPSTGGATTSPELVEV